MLNLEVSVDVIASGMCMLTSLRIVSRAILVLPAPVGAATRTFLASLNAALNTMD